MVKHRILHCCLLAGLPTWCRPKPRAPAATWSAGSPNWKQKMRLIDPAFGRENSRRRISPAGWTLLEKKMAQVLDAKAPGAEPPARQAPRRAVASAPTLQAGFRHRRLSGLARSGDAAAGCGLHGFPFQQGCRRSHSGPTSTASCCCSATASRTASSSGANWRWSTRWWKAAKRSGEVALEQAYLDFLIKPAFNLRAGMMLTPVGIINERHEPPAFNGVERPFVETLIIPTTWRELGFGFTGDLGRGFRYRAYLTSSLDASRFDAETGIAGGTHRGLRCVIPQPGKSRPPGVRRSAPDDAGRQCLQRACRLQHARRESARHDRRIRWTLQLPPARLARPVREYLGQPGRRTQLAPGTAVRRQSRTSRSQMRGYYFEPGVHVLPRRHAERRDPASRATRSTTRSTACRTATCRCRSSIALRG